MSLKAKQIECLSRLDNLTNSISEITAFLMSERLIDRDTFEQVRLSPLRAKELVGVLSQLQRSDKIQMLEYVWQVLPVETITLTIITDTVKREFSYQAF